MTTKPTTSLSDLVIDVQNNKNGAFEKLYKTTVSYAYNTAFLLLNSNDDIDDVIQNSYIQVFKNIKTLKDPSAFKGWLSVIVKHECLKYISKNIKTKSLFQNFHSCDFDMPIEIDLAVDLTEKKEVLSAIQKIVDKLPDDKRACVILYYYEQHDVNEISEILGIPVGTVKSRLFSARKILTKEFEKLKKKNDFLFGISFAPFIHGYFSQKAKEIVVPFHFTNSMYTSVAATEISVTAASTVSGTSIFSAATGATATTAITKATAVAVAATFAAGGGIAAVNHFNNPHAVPASTTTIQFVEEYTTASFDFNNIIDKDTTSKNHNVITSSTERSTSALNSTSATTSPAIKSNTTTATPKTTTRAHSTTTSRPSTTRTSTTTTTRLQTAIPESSNLTTSYQNVTTHFTAIPTPSTVVETTVQTTMQSQYKISSGVLTEYTGNESNVSIPAQIDSFNVSAIGIGAFSGNENIISVTIPSSVNKIGQEAFSDCVNLKSVSLSEKTESIGIGAFYGCSSLSSVTIPSSVLSIDDDAFFGCSALSSITIPSTVTFIGDNAFGNCNNIVIRCTENSTAHKFAVDNSLNFILI